MENFNTKVEQFAKAQNVEVQDTGLNEMGDKDALDFARKIKNPKDATERKAINDAVSIIEQKYNLAPGMILAWAESLISHQADNGTMSEASYYKKPQGERAREMLMILEEAKMASTPAEFEEYKKMMAPIIMKYKDVMPSEYVAKAQGNLQQKGFTEQDFEAVNSEDPSKIWKLVLTDHREEMAKHVAEWFTVDWPKYVESKHIDYAVSDCARFITNKYALEWNMQTSIKGLIDADFKMSFQKAVEKAKKDYPNDSNRAEKDISTSLQKAFEDYHQKHYLS